MTIRFLAGLLAFSAALAAHAQVFRCLDAQGRTTYQQSPCAGGEKGARVELTPDNGVASDAPALEAKWSAAAKQGLVPPGMPKRYVQMALGTPTEVRPGSSGERASEIWVYRGPADTRRIGFLDGRVTWEQKGDGAPAEPARRDVAGDSGANRTPVEQGQACEAALTAAGAPDRSDAIRIPTTSPTGQPVVATGTRYVFPADRNRDAFAFTCLGGYVYDIERAIR